MSQTNDSHDETYRSGFVALAGKPNVGKSTLMNEMLGVKLSITTSKPQTTRNRILGVRTFPEKGQIGFVDTPGIHRARRQMNRSMVKTAVESLRGVDAVCHVVDAEDFLSRNGIDVERSDLTDEDRFVLEQYEDLEMPFVLALNKVDEVSPKEKLLPLMEFFGSLEPFEEVVPTSATEGDNVHELIEVLLARLPEGAPMYPEDMLTDRAERFFAAEYIREEIMRETREEVPYGVAVEIDKFAEKEDGELLEIASTIHVEQSGQKGIVIGEGGQRLRRIGTRARKQLEHFFGRDVYLDTFVRVEEDWSEDESKLEKFL